jgi:hypothetical protein
MPTAELTVIVEIVSDEEGRWLVRLFKNTCGEYTDKRVARIEALEAAEGARELGGIGPQESACCDLRTKVSRRLAAVALSP